MKIIHASMGTLLTLLLAGCGSVNVAQLPDPHRHLGNLHAQPPDTNVMAGLEFRIVANVPTNIARSAKSPDGSFLACIVHSPMPAVKYEPETVFLIDSPRKRYYQLPNRDFPHRPISDLQWIDARCFCFDIWTGPHFGVHYVVDAKRKQLLHAIHFHDDFIEELENKRTAN